MFSYLCKETKDSFQLYRLSNNKNDNSADTVKSKLMCMSFVGVYGRLLNTFLDI
jgi:hypothetical protein